MRALLLTIVFSLLADPASASELLLLTHSGALHHLQTTADPSTNGPQQVPDDFAKPHGLAVSGSRIFIAHGDRLVEVAGKRHELPGHFGDLVALAGGSDQLWGATDKGEVVQIDRASGKRQTLASWPHTRQLAADGELLFAEHDGVIDLVGATPAVSFKLAGHALAMTASRGLLFVATKEGPLWQIDRQTGKQEQVSGVGTWWGTLALAAAGPQLYAVTQAGKVWLIDPVAHVKTIVAMSGWELAFALAVTR